jgi:hypothetical protein
MSNKTISINPSLFTIGSKTKKNKEKKEKPKNVPLISPNVLKNKLLKRIKEHKQKETKNTEKNTSNANIISSQNKINSETNNLESYSDEFNDSINYLQTLSQQKKINEEKMNYEKRKQKLKEDLERKTVKNYKEMNELSVNQNVQIDLPEELQQINQFQVEDTSAISSNKNMYDPVPYGVLKNGSKPTYRNWTKTQKSQFVTNPDLALTIEGIDINKNNSERERRLGLLRKKFKQKEMIENAKVVEQLPTQMEEIITETNTEKIQFNLESPNKNEKITEDIMMTQNLIQAPRNIMNQSMNQSMEINSLDDSVINKKITKKIIKTKYTLGKSKIKNLVSILIKDRGTRKKILTAQKDLKKKSIQDIKNYLRDHNLIKIGSNAPNDVIRKLYESAMLAGEITNNNTEILLHNLSKDTNF